VICNLTFLLLVSSFDCFPLFPVLFHLNDGNTFVEFLPAFTCEVLLFKEYVKLMHMFLQIAERTVSRIPSLAHEKSHYEQNVWLLCFLYGAFDALLLFSIILLEF